MSQPSTFRTRSVVVQAWSAETPNVCDKGPATTGPASRTLSSALSPGSSRNDWNTKPTEHARARLFEFRPKALTRVLSYHTSPCSASSRRPSTFSSVVFPEPDGPEITTNSPPFTVRFTEVSTGTRAPDGARYDFPSPVARSTALVFRLRSHGNNHRASRAGADGRSAAGVRWRRVVRIRSGRASPERTAP